MSNKIIRIQKYLGKLHNKQYDNIKNINVHLNEQIQSIKYGMNNISNENKQIYDVYKYIYELDDKLMNDINNIIKNCNINNTFDQNDTNLISSLASYKKNIRDNDMLTINQSSNNNSQKNALQKAINREEKIIIGHKILIKENKKKIANIDSKIDNIISEEELILENEVKRIINKIQMENITLSENLYLAYERKGGIEIKLQNEQAKYNILLGQYVAAKQQNNKIKKDLKSNLDTKKDLQTEYNANVLLLNNQLDSIIKDKQELHNRINNNIGNNSLNKAKLHRRLQHLIDEEKLVEERKMELYKKYLDNIDKFQSTSGIPKFIKIKREMENVNNNIKHLKHDINNFSNKYITPIYNTHIEKTLKLIDQFNNAKIRREKIDERNAELKSNTIDQCSKLIKLYDEEIVASNNKIDELKSSLINIDKNNISSVSEMEWINKEINHTLSLIDTFMKMRDEINSFG